MSAGMKGAVDQGWMCKHRTILLSNLRKKFLNRKPGQQGQLDYVLFPSLPLPLPIPAGYHCIHTKRMSRNITVQLSLFMVFDCCVLLRSTGTDHCNTQPDGGGEQLHRVLSEQKRVGGVPLCGRGRQGAGSVLCTRQPSAASWGIMHVDTW